MLFNNEPFGKLQRALVDSVYNSGGSGGLVPPVGYLFLIDNDGAYLIDNDGAYLIAPQP